MDYSTLEPKVYTQLRKRQIELAYVPPQRIGKLTPVYRKLIPWVKIAPWRMFIVWATVGVILLRFILGPSFVYVATILQQSF